MLLHAIRAHLAELGIATGAGVSQVTKMVAALVRGKPLDLPDLARVVLETLAQLVFDLQERLRTIDKRLAHWHYTNDLSNQLETIPGIGLGTASALAASIPDPSTFRSGRHFAVWLGSAVFAFDEASHRGLLDPVKNLPDQRVSTQPRQ